MLRILLKKYFSETILLWLACAAVLLVFPWVRIWTISQFELGGFAPIIEQFKAFEKFSPVPLSQFLTYEGVIGLTFAEPVVLLCMLTFAIARGTDVVSGEIGRGTMEMMLAQPISRAKILFAHLSISLAGIVLLASLCWLGLHLGIQTNSTNVPKPQPTITIPGTSIVVSNPFAEPVLETTPLADLVDSQIFIPSALNLASLAVFVFSLSVFMSSWDQYRWRSIGFVIGVYVLQLLLFILAKSTPRTRFLTPFSFFGAYQPDWMVQSIASEGMPMFAIYRVNVGNGGFLGSIELGPLGYSFILLALALALISASFWIFLRRDVPAPT